MKPISLPKPSGNLAEQMKGVWILKSREDHTKDGHQRIDPILGADPTGILAYSGIHFTAQFMKRDRSDQPAVESHSGTNNTIAVGGYDAYFGTYEVNEETGRVNHTLTGSINEENIGLSVWRDMRVVENQLIIQLDTTTINGESVTRTLIWERG